MAAEGPSMLGWAAVGLIAMALLLSVVAQFNGAWLSGEQEDGTQIGASASRTRTNLCISFRLLDHTDG